MVQNNSQSDDSSISNKGDFPNNTSDDTGNSSLIDTEEGFSISDKMKDPKKMKELEALIERNRNEAVNSVAGSLGSTDELNEEDFLPSEKTQINEKKISNSSSVNEELVSSGKDLKSSSVVDRGELPKTGFDLKDEDSSFLDSVDDSLTNDVLEEYSHDLSFQSNSSKTEDNLKVKDDLKTENYPDSSDGFQNEMKVENENSNTNNVQNQLPDKSSENVDTSIDKVSLDDGSTKYDLLKKDEEDLFKENLTTDSSDKGAVLDLTEGLKIDNPSSADNAIIDTAEAQDSSRINLVSLESEGDELVDTEVKEENAINVLDLTESRKDDLILDEKNSQDEKVSKEETLPLTDKKDKLIDVSSNQELEREVPDLKKNNDKVDSDELKKEAIKDAENFPPRMEKGKKDEKFFIKEGVSDEEEERATKILDEKIQVIDNKNLVDKKNSLTPEASEVSSFKKFSGEIDKVGELNSEKPFVSENQENESLMPERELTEEEQKKIEEILEIAKKKGSIFALKLVGRLKDSFLLEKGRNSLIENREVFDKKSKGNVKGQSEKEGVEKK